MTTEILDPHPVNPQSIAAAKDAQWRERQIVADQIGLRLNDDGRLIRYTQRDEAQEQRA